MGPFPVKNHLNIAPRARSGLIPLVEERYWSEWLASTLNRTGTVAWSWRFWPTPGRSWTRGIPCSARCSLGPTPESNKRCGEWIVPDLCRRMFSENSEVQVKDDSYASTTSLLTRTRYRGPVVLWLNSTPTAFLASPIVSNKIRVAWAYTATLRLGRLRTSRVRYAVSVVTLRPTSSTYVTRLNQIVGSHMGLIMTTH